MSRFLLLGGSGILGHSCAQSFRERKLEFEAPASARLDVRNLESLRIYCEEFHPDWIVNCTAWTDVDGAESQIEAALDLNEVAVQNLGLIAQEFDCKMVHISTDYVFDGEKKSPYLEDDTCNPQNQYGRSKRLGEIALLNLVPNDAYILRTSWLYGKTGKNFVKSIARKALAGEACKVVSDQFGSPTNSGDLAEAVVQVINHRPAPGIYHCVNEGIISWHDFATEIYSTMKLNTDLVGSSKSSEVQRPAYRPSYSALNTSKWKDAGLVPLPVWSLSLRRDLPEIVKEIQREGTQ